MYPIAVFKEKNSTGEAECQQVREEKGRDDVSARIGVKQSVG
jgi:hypothetical protein